MPSVSSGSRLPSVTCRGDTHPQTLEALETSSLLLQPLPPGQTLPGCLGSSSLPAGPLNHGCCQFRTKVSSSHSRHGSGEDLQPHCLGLGPPPRLPSRDPDSPAAVTRGCCWPLTHRAIGRRAEGVLRSNSSRWVSDLRAGPELCTAQHLPAWLTLGRGTSGLFEKYAEPRRDTVRRPGGSASHASDSWVLAQL